MPILSTISLLQLTILNALRRSEFIVERKLCSIGKSQLTKVRSRKAVVTGDVNERRQNQGYICLISSDFLKTSKYLKFSLHIGDLVFLILLLLHYNPKAWLRELWLTGKKKEKVRSLNILYVG